MILTQGRQKPSFFISQFNMNRTVGSVSYEGPTGVPLEVLNYEYLEKEFKFLWRVR